jgi:hypothetical protein
MKSFIKNKLFYYTIQVLMGILVLVGLAFIFQFLKRDKQGAFICKTFSINGNYIPRDGAGIVELNGSIYIVGGWNPFRFPKTTSNDVWKSTNGIDWVCIKTNTFGTPLFDSKNDWEGRHCFGCVVFNNKIWILGGDANQKYQQSTVFSSDDGITWVKHCSEFTDRLFDRFAPLSSVCNSNIFIMGGQTMPSFLSADNPNKSVCFYNDVFMSKDGLNWTRLKINSRIWSPRIGVLGSCVFRSQIVVVGGGIYQGGLVAKRLYYSDIWVSNNGIEWKNIQPANGWSKMRGGSIFHSVCEYDNKLWVVGGSDGNSNSDAVSYSSDLIHWTRIQFPGFAGGHAFSVISFKNRLFIIGGSSLNKKNYIIEKI